MAGLSLIGTYSSDSENEDRDVTSDCDEKHSQRRLPLPQSISKLKGVAHHEEIIDNPIDHDGRIRSFKHERGNWAALIYAEYEPEDRVRSWMKSVSSELPVQGKYLFARFHLSLTRTLVLKFHWIESFVDSVKNLCLNTEKLSIDLGDVEVYCNDERSRTFLAIKCSTPDDSLKRLVQALNRLLAEYELPNFYEEASFHISFMWSNGDVEEILKPFVPSLTMTLANVMLENSGPRITIDRLHCKIGNKMYAFKLK